MTHLTRQLKRFVVECQKQRIRSSLDECIVYYGKSRTATVLRQDSVYFPDV